MRNKLDSTGQACRHTAAEDCCLHLPLLQCGELHHDRVTTFGDADANGRSRRPSVEGGLRRASPSCAPDSPAAYLPPALTPGMDMGDVGPDLATDRHRSPALGRSATPCGLQEASASTARNSPAAAAGGPGRAARARLIAMPFISGPSIRPASSGSGAPAAGCPNRRSAAPCRALAGESSPPGDLRRFPIKRGGLLGAPVPAAGEDRPAAGASRLDDRPVATLDALTGGTRSATARVVGGKLRVEGRRRRRRRQGGRQVTAAGKLGPAPGEVNTGAGRRTLIPAETAQCEGVSRRIVVISSRGAKI